MSNPYFQFKQFTVRQDSCAMKVGTDGVLVGAWASVEQSSQVLDIGTGTGLIALMCAQRTQAQITGIDIDLQSARQAEANVADSPWQKQIEIVCDDFRTHAFPHLFDHIVSNPPFFIEDVKCPDESRNRARHADSLTFEELLAGVKRLLTKGGKFTLILPTSAVSDFLRTAFIFDLYPETQLTIFPRPELPSKRTLLCLTNLPCELHTETLYIEETPQKYSPNFIRLLHNYYLYL